MRTPGEFDKLLRSVVNIRVTELGKNGFYLSSRKPWTLVKLMSHGPVGKA